MEALRDLADDFNVRDPRKLYRLARQRDLDVTQAMAFEALKADVGRQVQAPRPRGALGKSAAEGPNDRLQADLIDFSQNTRGKTKYGLVVMDVFTREAAVEPLQNKNAETVGRATKRAAKELTGDDGNFVVTTDLGNEFATLDRELPENAVHRTKRPEDRNAIAVVDRGIQTLKKDLATRVARKGGQWSDHFERVGTRQRCRVRIPISRLSGKDWTTHVHGHLQTEVHWKDIATTIHHQGAWQEQANHHDPNRDRRFQRCVALHGPANFQILISGVPRSPKRQL